MDQPFLFLDCQTTGMHPSRGYLLEIAWGVAGEKTESYLIKLPNGELIPNAVKEITGITQKDLEVAMEPAEVLAALSAYLKSKPEIQYALVHYAQFEKPWLEELFKGEFPLPPLSIKLSHYLGILVPYGFSLARRGWAHDRMFFVQRMGFFA